MAAKKFMHRTCTSLLQNRSVLSTPMLPNLCACLRERHYSLECGRIKLAVRRMVFHLIPEFEPLPSSLATTVTIPPTWESGSWGMKRSDSVDFAIGFPPKASVITADSYTCEATLRTGRTDLFPNVWLAN